MKTRLALSAIATIVTLVSQGVLAQASSPTRAEVREQIKAGALAPAGEAPSVNPDKQTETLSKSTKTRTERKSETSTARDAGALKPAGEAAGAREEKAEVLKATGANRADRKADTQAAVKARTTQPAGEAPQPSADGAKK